MKLCIICLLSDHTQEKIRNLSHSRNDRFEETLKTYKKDFIFEYSNLIDIKDCDKHNSLSPNLIQWVSDLQKSLPNKSDIEQFFNDITNAYVNWIHFNQDKSFDIIKTILQKINFINKTYSKSKKIFFRARKSDHLLSKEDLYHIPFNKRYLIGNQRYSISGQPCLYFGLSIPDVISELRGNYNDFNHYNFSGYMLKDEFDLKFLNFTNPFPELFSIIDNLAKAGGSLTFNQPGLRPNKIDCEENFYLLILISCCSFNRRLRSEGQVFSEEYVLPQIVTQFVYKFDFDGIAFNSTRIDKTQIYSKASYYQTEYKLNLVIFTKYHPHSLYDDDLLNKFLISEPKTADLFETINEDDLAELTKEIIAITNTKNVFSNLSDLSEYTGIGSKNDFHDIYILQDSKELRYFEHDLGKFHLFLLYCFLLDIRNKIV